MTTRDKILAAPNSPSQRKVRSRYTPVTDLGVMQLALVTPGVARG